MPPKFQIGDQVTMPGVPIAIEVLELSECPDGADCPLGAEIFRFDDPGGMGDDWMHSSEFEKVGR
jgi:hypothetical protein